MQKVVVFTWFLRVHMWLVHWNMHGSLSECCKHWGTLVNRCITLLFNCMVKFILYLVSNMGLQYLTFMGRNLVNKKKLTPVRIMNSIALCSKNIVNSVGIFNDSANISNNFME